MVMTWIERHQDHEALSSFHSQFNLPLVAIVSIRYKRNIFLCHFLSSSLVDTTSTVPPWDLFKILISWYWTVVRYVCALQRGRLTSWYIATELVTTFFVIFQLCPFCYVVIQHSSQTAKWNKNKSQEKSIKSKQKI